MVFIARDLSYDFSAYDCGLLAQNIMLSAWSLGVGYADEAPEAKPRDMGKVMFIENL